MVYLPAQTTADYIPLPWTRHLSVAPSLSELWSATRPVERFGRGALLPYLVVNVWQVT